MLSYRRPTDSFHVTVEIFMRVQLRGIRGKVEHLDLIFMRIQPFFYRFAMMRSEVVHNQKDLPSGILGQLPHGCWMEIRSTHYTFMVKELIQILEKANDKRAEKVHTLLAAL
jgi:hypothetical protein